MRWAREPSLDYVDLDGANAKAARTTAREVSSCSFIAKLQPRQTRSLYVPPFRPVSAHVSNVESFLSALSSSLADSGDAPRPLEEISWSENQAWLPTVFCGARAAPLL